MDSLLLADVSPCSATLLGLPEYDPESPQRRNISKQNSRGKIKRGNRVLMIGRLPELALYRAEVLGRAGFKVFIATDANDALRLMRGGNFDAVVLSYTLPSETVARLSDAAREYCPDCPVIAIAESSVFDRRIAPNAVALASDGPAGLVAAVTQVLRVS